MLRRLEGEKLRRLEGKKIKVGIKVSKVEKLRLPTIKTIQTNVIWRK
jgi:hypothetical protein